MSDTEVDLTPHSHDPNPTPPSSDPAFSLYTAQGATRITMETLAGLPRVRVPQCYVVSTGHGTSGPFTFGGTSLAALLRAHVTEPWVYAAVISGDGFATRLDREELGATTHRPIILAYEIDGRPMTRSEGLVRLIVPGERDDALRQVKWVAEIRLLTHD